MPTLGGLLVIITDFFQMYSAILIKIFFQQILDILKKKTGWLCDRLYVMNKNI